MINAQLCLVTGASSGIGKAIAEQLLDDGHTVVATARNVEKMEGLRTRGAHIHHLDVSDENSITATMSEILSRHGSIDVLINNAGLGMFGAIETISLDDARYQFEVNLFGAARLSQLVLPAMRARHAGRIINISSMSGKVHSPLSGWYTASKHALEGWSDCLRLEVAAFGVDVIIVEPGTIKTGFSDSAELLLQRAATSGPYAELARSMLRVLQKNVAKGTGSEPHDVARVVSSAIEARRPRTRYAIGFGAKPLICLRRWLTDRAFDRIVRHVCTH